MISLAEGGGGWRAECEPSPAALETKFNNSGFGWVVKVFDLTAPEGEDFLSGERELSKSLRNDKVGDEKRGVAQPCCARGLPARASQRPARCGSQEMCCCEAASRKRMQRSRTGRGSACDRAGCSLPARESRDRKDRGSRAPRSGYHDHELRTSRPSKNYNNAKLSSLMIV